LLDGRNQETISANVYAKEIFSELRQDDYQTIMYTDLNQVCQDIEKELGSWNPELRVPELETYSKDIVRVVPNLNTVMTDRLRMILEHPVFARLKLISELGLIALVYPTADHSRYDHVLGTYTYVGAYVKSLFNDRQNPIFRNLVDEHDIKAVLLASLFHDLGQYPHAHDLEEVCPGVFKHSRFSEDLLDDPTKDAKGRTILNIIEDAKYGWGVELSWLKQILGAHSRQYTLDREKRESRIRGFKVDMLSALIDGPIDADKADYIVRDTSACRIPYGEQLDIERLLRVLTVAVISDPKSLHRVTVGVYEKGRAAAEALGLARHLLFASVYWHHTSRILKSMLQYAVAMELPNEVFRENENPQTLSLRQKLKDFIVRMSPPFEAYTFDSHHLPSEAREARIASDRQPPGQVLESLKTRPSVRSDYKDSWYPGISYTDWLMLRWLRRELPNPNRRSSALIDGIMQRNLYKRVTTWQRSHNQELAARLDRMSWPDRIALCERLQSRIRDEVMRTWKTSGTTSEKDREEVDRLFNQEDYLAVLVDIPDDPTRKTGFQSSRPLTFVPELRQKTYYQESEESEESANWNNTVVSLMDSIASIRILCHPDLVAPISKAFQPASREIRRLVLQMTSP
jgi:HD superfamily phosphohydrolase